MESVGCVLARRECVQIPLSSCSHYKQEWISQQPPAGTVNGWEWGKMMEAASLQHYLNNRPGNSISRSLIRPHQLPQLSCTSWRLVGWLLLVTDESRSGGMFAISHSWHYSRKSTSVSLSECGTGRLVWRMLMDIISVTTVCFCSSLIICCPRWDCPPLRS